MHAQRNFNRLIDFLKRARDKSAPDIQRWLPKGDARFLTLDACVHSKLVVPRTLFRVNPLSSADGLFHTEAHTTPHAHLYIACITMNLILTHNWSGFYLGKHLMRYSERFSVKGRIMFVEFFRKCSFFVSRTSADGCVWDRCLVFNAFSRIDIHYWESEECAWIRHRVFFSISWNISPLSLRRSRNGMKYFEQSRMSELSLRFICLCVRNSSTRISYIIHLTAFTIRDITYTHEGIFTKRTSLNACKSMSEEYLLEHVLGLKRDQRSLCNFPISTTRPSCLRLPQNLKGPLRSTKARHIPRKIISRLDAGFLLDQRDCSQ